MPEILLLMNEGYVLKEADAWGRKHSEDVPPPPRPRSHQMDRKRQEEAEDQFPLCFCLRPDFVL